MRFQLIAAVHVFLIKDGQVLMLRRFNTGYEDGRYSVPAGHLDGGETVLAAAQREVLEECGVHIPLEHFTPTGVMHRQAEDERVDFFLTARCWEGRIVNREPNKCDDLSWWDVTALPPNTIGYVRAALQTCLTGQWFLEYGWD